MPLLTKVNPQFNAASLAKAIYERNPLHSGKSKRVLKWEDLHDGSRQVLIGDAQEIIERLIEWKMLE